MLAATRTGRRLHDDHDRTVALLNRLEAHLDDAERRGVPSVDDGDTRILLGDVLDVLGRELDHHFDFEESVVFPLIAQAGAHELTRHLTDEHDGMRPIGRRLMRICGLALAAGFDDDSYYAFVHLGYDLVDRLERHLQVEETVLLQAVETMLRDEPDLDRDMVGRCAIPHGDEKPAGD